MSASTASNPIQQIIDQCVHPAVRHLSVEETDDMVVISGRVTCYYHKQLAQEYVLPIVGVRKLVNQVTVTGEN